MKVLVIDAIAPEGIAYLRERGFQVDEVSSKLPRAELLGRLADYEAIITRSSTTVTTEFLAHARRLRIERHSTQTAEPVCNGTLLSATQYVRDVDLEGFQDARLAPLGPIEQEDLAKWMANFVRP